MKTHSTVCRPSSIQQLWTLLRSGVAVLAMGLGVSQASLAMTTTLTFDDLPSGHGTIITNQYQTAGVISSGATVILASVTPWPAQSGAFVTYASGGLMTFDFNSLILGQVSSVSLYVSGVNTVEIFAFDSSDQLLAQTASATAEPLLEFLSLTSLGGPIDHLEILAGGSSYTMDTLTITSSGVPEPSSAILVGLGLLGLMGAAKRNSSVRA